MLSTYELQYKNDRSARRQTLFVTVRCCPLVHFDLSVRLWTLVQGVSEKLVISKMLPKTETKNDVELYELYICRNIDYGM